MCLVCLHLKIILHAFNDNFLYFSQFGFGYKAFKAKVLQKLKFYFIKKNNIKKSDIKLNNLLEYVHGTSDPLMHTHPVVSP